MKFLFASVLLLSAIPALAQSADALYSQACGPKDVSFTVDHVKGQPIAPPEPGKALVYVIQKGTFPGFVSRIGLDGSWAGVIRENSYIPLSVAPGEHHLCAATQNRKHPVAELLHFKAEAGKTYFYVVRGMATDSVPNIAMVFEVADRDEALYLIASDPQSVAKPKP